MVIYDNIYVREFESRYKNHERYEVVSEDQHYLPLMDFNIFNQTYEGHLNSWAHIHIPTNYL